ncbi:MAG TPA: hypothetical protein VGZ92_15555 [Bradyrhizobium sp.]|jgi:hypothetical protein|nr:hypothetical protein [Bradyrhizobium sp.]
MTRNRAISSSIALHPINHDADCTRRRNDERGVDEQASSEGN